MKTETFSILEKVKNKELTPLLAQEQLFVLFGVSGMLVSNNLASWALRNGWTYNFCDNKWWQLQDDDNYIKKSTEELAKLIMANCR